MKPLRQIINEKRTERNRKRRLAYLNRKHREQAKPKKPGQAKGERRRVDILSAEQRSFSVNDQPRLTDGQAALTFGQKIIQWIKSLWRG